MLCSNNWFFVHCHINEDTGDIKNDILQVVVNDKTVHHEELPQHLRKSDIREYVRGIIEEAKKVEDYAQF